jgi:signal transduction histidine kinase
MWPLRRRQALISALGLLIAAGLGVLAVAVSHSGASGRTSGRAPALDLGLLAGLACAALAVLAALVGLAGLAALAALAALALRLLTRTDELRQANQALAARNRELEAASQAKTRFVANLSHELRNPLSAVVGYSELMASGRFGRLDGRQREHLGVIRESGEHLASLVEELLDMAQVETGHLRLEGAPIDPAAVIRGCVAALQTMAARRELRLEIDAPASGLVMLDPTRLRQVVLNFVSNAIKFSPQGGTVVVALRRQTGGVRVEVSDAGPGLSVRDQTRVFDEFFQVPGLERSGTGLGLAVTRLIVEAQGGHVEVRSQLGAGSTFSAWLPAAEVVAVDELVPRIDTPREHPAGDRARVVALR